MIQFGIVIVTMSFVTFVIYGIDKHRAVKHRRRVSEKTLLVLAFLFGAAGAILATSVFSHKSNKLKFKVLNVLFLSAHVLLGVYIYTQR